MESRPDELWWRTGVFYEIYRRSFADSNGDGVGDLEGLRRRLDYLTWLGVDAVWLSPFYRSPMADFGYDVADYCDVDPLFGSLSDFDRLLAEAHQRGLKVIVDWVPNHSSDQHPWFIESRSSRDNPKRDWYIWRDGAPDEPPNNWIASFAKEPAWTWDERTQAWYLHLFLPEQPDLNWANPEVVDAMHGATAPELSKKYKVGVETVRDNKKVKLVLDHVEQQQQGKLPPKRFAQPAKKELPE